MSFLVRQAVSQARRDVFGGLGEAKFAGNLPEDGNLQRRRQCDDTKEKGSE